MLVTAEIFSIHIILPVTILTDHKTHFSIKMFNKKNKLTTHHLHIFMFEKFWD